MITQLAGTGAGAREPVAGRVKTRLIPTLGETAATALYRKMLYDTLAVATQVAADRVELWVDRPGPASELRARARDLGMTTRVQSGADLGARMHGAFVETLHSARAAVLIGSDCPEYDAGYIAAAFDALDRHDAVIGPARDGGYVLIGMKTAEPRLFRDVPWGTARVLAVTRERLSQLRWNWHELPPKQDLDRPGDLSRFPQLLAALQP